MADSQIGDGTAAGLAQYLDVLVEKGRATDGAIRPLKTAFVKVMKKVEGDNWRSVDVNNIDVADYISRFSVLTRGTYTPKSIAVYRARMQRVVDWYSRFMSPDEAGWMPQILTRAPRGSKTEDTGQPKVALPARTVVSRPVPDLIREEKTPTATAHTPVAAQVPVDQSLIDFPFPLSDGQIAILKLPSVLSPQDAARLTRYISSLVIEDNTLD